MKIPTNEGRGSLEWISSPTIFTPEDKNKFTEIKKRARLRLHERIKQGLHFNY